MTAALTGAYGDAVENIPLLTTSASTAASGTCPCREPGDLDEIRRSETTIFIKRSIKEVV